ncbi:MAG: hypothetical protein EA339_15205 [Rhodobacteraceae bacterium]|nr:MAG: hypothetical protein EA339_15205 [Paracoccaceae bacterium]
MSALLKTTRKPKAGPKVPRRAIIVQAICDVIREDWRDGTCPTLLSHEGAIWAALRSGLCLEGMGWHDANKAARDMLHEAFARTGAKRPAWKEGQPEWCDGGVIRDTRTTCANCGKGLEPEQKIYCSKTCFDAHRARLYRADNLEKVRALERIKNERRRASGEREGQSPRSERWKDARDKARTYRD